MEIAGIYSLLLPSWERLVLNHEERQLTIHKNPRNEREFNVVFIKYNSPSFSPQQTATVI